jgi:hypothetical protein
VPDDGVAAKTTCGDMKVDTASNAATRQPTENLSFRMWIPLPPRLGDGFFAGKT